MPTAIVTGPGSGIGKASAVALAERGYVDPHTEERPAIPAGRPGDARDGGMLLMAAVANQDFG